MTTPWSIPIRLAEVDRGGVRLAPAADAATRARIAADVGVDAVVALDADVELKPWLDGVEMHGRISAVVTQTCGLSLDPFDATIAADFIVRAVPNGSQHAPSSEVHEVAIDPEAEDPPDVLEGEAIDVGAYLVEHLALAVDPFPRKPDAVFDPPVNPGSLSPFAALAVLKGKGEAN